MNPTPWGLELTYRPPWPGPEVDRRIAGGSGGWRSPRRHTSASVASRYHRRYDNLDARSAVGRAPVAVRPGLTHCPAMRETGHVQRRRRVLWCAGALVTLVASGAIGVLTARDRSVVAGPGPDREPGRARQVAAPEDPGSDYLVELQLFSGDELEIAVSSLPAGEPVLLSLGLPTSPAGSLPVRVLATDGRILETTGVVYEDDPTRASVEIEADWLGSSGRYIVEIKTKERTHFPLRRYAIEVR